MTVVLHCNNAIGVTFCRTCQMCSRPNKKNQNIDLSVFHGNIIWAAIISLDLWSAEIFFDKRSKCFFQFEIIINVLVSSFRFI